MGGTARNNGLNSTVAIPAAFITNPQPIQYISPVTIAYPAPVPVQYQQSIPQAELHRDDCICTVCVCGVHKCPPTPRVGSGIGYDNPLSESHARYQAPPAGFRRPDKLNPLNNKNALGPNLPLEGNSVYRQDYPWHNNYSGPAKKNNNSGGLYTENIPFNHTSEMKRAYQPKTLNNSPTTARPQTQPSVSLPDDRLFQSEHRAAYTPKSVPREGSNVPGRGSQAPLNIPFQAQTNYQTDYKNFGPGVGARMYPRDQVERVNLSDDRDFLSEHRGQYTPKKTFRCPAASVAVKSKTFSGHVKVERIGPDTFRRV